jgi:MFS family permease
MTATMSMHHDADALLEKNVSFMTVQSTEAILMPSSEYDNKEAQDFTDLRFWLIIVTLSTVILLATLDGTVLATALPYIASELDVGEKYIWVANALLLAQTVVQPPISQLCNIFGRRNMTIISVVTFGVGSAIAGSARTANVLIAGRVVQGVGTGGTTLLVELIICDLVPLRERSKYLAIVLSVGAFGSIVGPVVGGALAKANWRWIFYLNLPITAINLLVIVPFLRLRYTRSPTWLHALKRIDWVGNILFIGSICALLLGLIYGGTSYPWGSWHVITPIVIGAVGWGIFHLYEHSRYCSEPSVPSNLFGNRTSFAGFCVVFISNMILTWIGFVWPIYFQGVKGQSPLRAGVDLLPYQGFLIPAAGIAGFLLSKLGVYRPLHAFGFALGILARGLNTLLSEDSSPGVWVSFQMVDAIGMGFLVSTVLPAILASLPESDVAAATGVYSFLRSLGWVWGTTIPGLIFTSCFDQNANRISDAAVRQNMMHGRAYQFISGDYIGSLDPSVRREVVDTYSLSLKRTWQAAIAFACLGLLFVFLEKHVPLRTELETQFGRETINDSSGEESC